MARSALLTTRVEIIRRNRAGSGCQLLLPGSCWRRDRPSTEVWWFARHGGSVRRLDLYRRGEDRQRLRGCAEGYGRRISTRSGTPTATATSSPMRSEASSRAPVRRCKAIEASFHQDLNGDGTIGFVTTRVEIIRRNRAGSGCQLLLAGSCWRRDWPSAEVWWYARHGGSVRRLDLYRRGTDRQRLRGCAGRLPAPNQYTVWNTDSNGNVISNAVGGIVSGTSFGAARDRGEFPPGSEWRWHDRHCHDKSRDHRRNRAGSGWQLLLAGSCWRRDWPSAEVWWFARHGGSVRAVGPLSARNRPPVVTRLRWKATGADQYTVWNTDSNGNVISNAVGGIVSGSSSALQGIEASFHQDLNGDGIILLSGSGSIIGTNSLVVGSGASAELTGAYSGSVSFAGATGTLVIDNSANFTGTIGGQLATGDVIDLVDITAGAGATIGYSGNNSPGTLTVSDGTKTASIALLGNYSLGNFTASSDGHGGTSVVDPPLPTDQHDSLTSENSGAIRSTRLQPSISDWRCGRNIWRRHSLLQGGKVLALRWPAPVNWEAVCCRNWLSPLRTSSIPE